MCVQHQGHGVMLKHSFCPASFFFPLPVISVIDPKVAPALQQQRDELSKARIQDTLRHKIDHRPTREELVEHHILGK